MGTFIKHEPCPRCGSRDNLARYDDGSGYCFGCQYTEKLNGENAVQENSLGLVDLEYKALITRKISEETCRKYGYQVGTYQGKRVQVCSFKDKGGQVVAHKLRYPNKDFK